MPTDVGVIVNDFLMQYFPSILDYHFTANVEATFDEIAQGHERWNDDIEKFYNDFHPLIEQVKTMELEHRVGERELGVDPDTGKPVYAKVSRFGPVVQLGSSEDTEKPRFASLLQGQSILSITLEEALKLFDLPRTLGQIDGQDVTVAVGRFGPYVKIGKEYVSIPKDISPQELTLEQAGQLMDAKHKADAERVLITFAEEPELQVLKGQYGPYISFKKQNYKIPKGVDAATLTLEKCREIVADEGNLSRRATRTTRRTKTTNK